MPIEPLMGASSTHEALLYAVEPSLVVIQIDVVTPAKSVIVTGTSSNYGRLSNGVRTSAYPRILPASLDSVSGVPKILGAFTAELDALPYDEDHPVNDASFQASHYSPE